MNPCVRTLFAVSLACIGIARGETPAAGEASGVQPCAVDRDQLLALDQQAFDQDMNGGWRTLEADPRCREVAADLIRDYRERNKNESAILLWHEGQLRADVGQTTEAIALFERAHMPSSTAPAWNEYVDATIAFLKGDRKAFDAARAALVALPQPAWFRPNRKGPTGKLLEWPPNLNVVDGLGRCFGMSYREAYGNCPK